MRLKTAVTGFSGILLAFFAGLCTELIRTTHLLDKEAESLAGASASIQVTNELKTYLLVHNRNAFLHSIDQDSGHETRQQTEVGDLSRLLTEAGRHVNTPEEAEVWNVLKTAIANYLSKQKIVEESRTSPVEQYSQISQEIDAALAAADRFVDLNRTQMDHLLRSINEQNDVADRVAVILLLTGGLTLIGVILAVISGIARPLINLTGAMREYGRGNGQARAQIKGIREVKDVARNFNSMAESLAERQKDQLRFLAAIAHDLRNPLHSISLASELLMSKAEGQHKEISRVIYRQVSHLDRLVGDLLDTTHIESGHLELNLENQDVASIVKDVVNLHRNESSLHKLAVEVPREPLSCRCDAGRIFQVMNNLVSNAIKYSPMGGAVIVRAQKEDEGIIISVEDQGIGIDSDDCNEIFKPFHRTKSTKGTIPGIGLGLATSRRIIEAHGGRLTVSSEIGKGSTFQIFIPNLAVRPQVSQPPPPALANRPEVQV